MFFLCCIIMLSLSLSKRNSEHLKTTTETVTSKKRSQDYWSMRRLLSIPQSPTRKACLCVDHDNIDILGYWGIRWGPDGGGLSTSQIEQNPSSTHLTSFFVTFCWLPSTKSPLTWGRSFEFQINTILITNSEQVELAI